MAIQGKRPTHFRREVGESARAPFAVFTGLRSKLTRPPRRVQPVNVDKEGLIDDAKGKNRGLVAQPGRPGDDRVRRYRGHGCRRCPRLGGSVAPLSPRTPSRSGPIAQADPGATRLGALPSGGSPMTYVNRPASSMLLSAPPTRVRPDKLRTAVDVPSTLWDGASSLRTRAKIRRRSRPGRRRSHGRP